jgi:enamine deaminase RidA (YjgF/YER057c/UK114 family)
MTGGPDSPPFDGFIEPPGWPRGAGYAHAVARTGRTLALAGQIGWDPRTQQLVPGGFAAQCRQAFANVRALLDAAGARPEDLVRITWYITDRAAYLAARVEIGAAWREYFGRHYPAMTVVVVAGLIEPAALVELEATAVIHNGDPP